MAGGGKRFKEAGYTQIKPLIPVRNGKTMIEVVIDNLKPLWGRSGVFTFVVKNEDISQLAPVLVKATGGCTIIGTDTTEGAACTCLKAKGFICDADELLVANCDQYLLGDLRNMMVRCNSPSYGSTIFTMPSDGDRKWSYTRSDENGYVIEVAEKNPISDRANTGLLYLTDSDVLFEGIETMIKCGDRTNGEFYTLPAVNHMTRSNAKHVEVKIEQYGVCMFGLGTPEDLQRFQQLDLPI